MIAPIKKYSIGLRFGVPVPYYPFKHPGIDLLPLVGQDRTLISPGNGVVSLKFYSVGAGNCIDINLDNGLSVRLCHMLTKAWVNVGQRVTEGQDVGMMGATGIFIYPRGYVHLHYVVFKTHAKRDADITDPAPYLVGDPNKIDIPSLFTQIWKRMPAQGEINYFTKRLENHTIKDRNDMIDKMRFWYDTVYPKGKYSAQGDERWQIEKKKYV